MREKYGLFKKKSMGVGRAISFILAIMMLFRSVAFPSHADELSLAVEEVIRAGFYEFSESIDVSLYSLTPEELSRVFSSVVKDDPYLFFVDYTLSYSFRPGGCVLSLKPTYNLWGQAVHSAWDYCRAQVIHIADIANNYDTDVQKALFVHDYICSNYGYDASLQSDDMYSFFLTGRGTCQSYAAVYMAVMRECGIEAHFVASDTIAHIWNYVKLDGEWYHVDLTWDDSEEDVSRRHFLCSDTEASDRGHKDWYSSINVACRSEKYFSYDFDALLHCGYAVGDVDHDEDLSLVDLIALRRSVLFGLNTHICQECADVDLDGVVSVTDIEFLRRKFLLAN